MTDYDVPWKEVLDAYLNDFLELCLPHIHAGIDWNIPIENHEQELPQLFPNSQTSGRVADLKSSWCGVYTKSNGKLSRSGDCFALSIG